jgi:hypothetical protein
MVSRDLGRLDKEVAPWRDADLVDPYQTLMYLSLAAAGILRRHWSCETAVLRRPPGYFRLNEKRVPRGNGNPLQCRGSRLTPVTGSAGRAGARHADLYSSFAAGPGGGKVEHVRGRLPSPDGVAQIRDLRLSSPDMGSLVRPPLVGESVQ